MYIVKDANGRILPFDEIYELYKSIHKNHRDTTDMSVQVDHDDYISFYETMTTAGCTVAAYTPTHE